MPYKLEIRWIVPNEENPRDVSKHAFAKLVESMRQDPDFLRVRPIVINQDFKIIGGNMRYKAAIELGWQEVWVEKVDWNEEEQRRFTLKDNTHAGTWNWDVLANEWELPELQSAGLNFEWSHEPKEESEICSECGKKL